MSYLSTNILPGKVIEYLATGETEANGNIILQQPKIILCIFYTVGVLWGGNEYESMKREAEAEMQRDVNLGWQIPFMNERLHGLGQEA